MPTLQLESQYSGLVGGVDEVGRGPWAGPVIAAVAVFLKPEDIPSELLNGIKDSKKLTKQKRDSLYEILLTFEDFQYGIGEATVEEIDHHNILKATFLAMERAVQKLPQLPPTLLIDGKFIPSFHGTKTVPVIGGDGISLSIAAASIIAKVTRDNLMEELSRDFPHFGWERNAGYGTAEHQKALRAQGVTPHHRKSFAPIRAILNQQMSPSMMMHQGEMPV